MKIGVMGGTFNPVHYAHLILAAQAKDQFMLDKILFMPSKHPPHKNNNVIVSDEHRLNMLKLAVGEIPDFEISEFELQREGVTYSADTFSLLHEQDSENEYYLIIGGDSLMEFEKWYHPEIILKYAHIIAATRSSISYDELVSHINRLNEKYNSDIQLLSAPLMDISSSFIRTNAAIGADIHFYMPAGVCDYILDNHLYEDERILNITKVLINELPHKRYLHTLGVAKTAAVLAEENGYDVVRAYLAGLLHDCAKGVPYDKILEVAEGFGLTLTETEKRLAGALVHAKLGEYFARTRFGITDEDILLAIRYHTTGRPEMTLLEKIIFISDFIEPKRYMEIPSQIPLCLIRSESHRNLDLAVYYELCSKIKYLQDIGSEMDCTTMETYEYYKNKLSL